MCVCVLVNIWSYLFIKFWSIIFTRKNISEAVIGYSETPFGYRVTRLLKLTHLITCQQLRRPPINTFFIFLFFYNSHPSIQTLETPPVLLLGVLLLFISICWLKLGLVTIFSVFNQAKFLFLFIHIFFYKAKFSLKHKIRRCSYCFVST